MKNKKRNKLDSTLKEENKRVQAKCSSITPREVALQANTLSSRPNKLQSIHLQRPLACLTLKLSTRLRRKRNEIKKFKIVYKYKS
jgi:hypothetical protein